MKTRHVLQMASFTLAMVIGTTTALADAASSNYRLRWSVLDSGGTTSSSTNYALAGTIQATGIGPSTSTSYALNGGFQSIPDTDGDTVRNFIDNCSLVANLNQFNGNAGTGPGLDIFGNACDADLNENGVVNFADLAAFKAVFGTTDPEANLNGIGSVNFADLALFKSLFGSTPGPSGLP